MQVNGIDKRLLKKILDRGVQYGGDFCEVYYEYRLQNMLTLEENKIKESRGYIDEGVGVRVLKGHKIGYAYSDIVGEEPLLKAAETAAFIARGSDHGICASIPLDNLRSHKCSYEHPSGHKMEEKANLLYRANEAARKSGDFIYQTHCSYFDEIKHIEIANTEGLHKSDEQSVMNMYVVCFAQKDNIRDVGRAFAGGRHPFSYFEIVKPEELGETASRQAIVKLDAKDAPAGMYPVIIAGGWGGVLVHEAVGHGLENDFHRKKTSLYTGKEGQKVASELVTIVDDGTIPNGRGTVNIDDEGTDTRRNVLIENGILTGLMSDLLNARLLGAERTGNGRRMSYREYPLPRMTNTFIDKGNTREGDLIRDIKKGIYAAQLGGGQVDITTGNFVFEISEGYMIENGEITAPIRGANLIGNGPEAMKKVAGVSHHLRIESGTGTCGKDGQSVYVGVGQPSVFISGMTVGGTGT